MKLYYISYISLSILIIVLFSYYYHDLLNDTQQNILALFVTYMTVVISIDYIVLLYYKERAFINDPFELLLFVVMVYITIDINYKRYFDKYNTIVQIVKKSSEQYLYKK